MKQKVIAVCLAVVMMLSVGSLTMAEDMPGPDGDALWNYISKVSPYKKWSFWPEQVVPTVHTRSLRLPGALLNSYRIGIYSA